MFVADLLAPDRLAGLAAAEKDATRFRRIRAVALALGGDSAPDIARALGVGRRTVQAWVARYNDEGPAGFDDRPGRGRPCRLSDEQLRRLRQRIDAGPLPGDGTCTLRGP